MTNREKYKQAFSAVHAPENFSLEVEQLEKTKRQYKFKKMVASVAACMALIVSSTVAYTADVGGIQRTLQLWIHGEQTEATIQFDGNGSYDMQYTDADGAIKSQSGGGIALAPDGSQFPVSEEDLMEELTAPDVRYEEDGSVWVYWFDQKIEITDKFKDDVCRVKLVNGDDTLYMTIKYGGGYATSPHKYVNTWEFN